jgi:hypothetical protein
MKQDTETIPGDGVSKKLKLFVTLLTLITFIALVALFTKLATKQSSPKKKALAVTKPQSSQLLIDEYSQVGARLINVGLTEQAIDQYIKIWEMQTTGTLARANAAQTIGILYADLGNCQEALVWLFRAEVSDLGKTLPLQPLIDTCLSKVRSEISDQ